MAKVCYEFELFEDRELIERYAKTMEMAAGIVEWTNKMRTLRDYPADQFNHSALALLDMLWEQWFEMWGEDGIDPRDI